MFTHTGEPGPSLSDLPSEKAGEYLNRNVNPPEEMIAAEGYVRKKSRRDRKKEVCSVAQRKGGSSRLELVLSEGRRGLGRKKWGVSDLVGIRRQRTG